MSGPIDIRGRELLPVSEVPRVKYKKDLLGILIPEEEILSRVNEQAREISEDYESRGIRRIHAMCVLQGAKSYFHDLLFSENFTLETTWGDADCYSYDSDSGTTPIKKPRIRLLHPAEIREQDVLVVEDILDRGRTLEYLIEEIEKHDPLSISVATLLHKPDRQEIEIIDMIYRLYVGFIIPNKFVVGYGLDLRHKYRDIKHIGVLKPEIYARSI